MKSDPFTQERQTLILLKTYLRNMKIVLEVSDSKAPFFLELLTNFPFVTLENDSDITERIEIKTAFKNASLIRQNKLKTRPAKDFLNEL